MADDYVAVRNVLRNVYGKGKMVDSCAKHVAEKLPSWLEEPDPLRDLTLFLWNWFPGGNTARHAAEQVMGAIHARWDQ